MKAATILSFTKVWRQSCETWSNSQLKFMNNAESLASEYAGDCGETFKWEGLLVMHLINNYCCICHKPKVCQTLHVIHQRNGQGCILQRNHSHINTQQSLPHCMKAMHYDHWLTQLILLGLHLGYPASHAAIGTK